MTRGQTMGNGTGITVDQEGIPQTSFRPVPVLLLRAACGGQALSTCSRFLPVWTLAAILITPGYSRSECKRVNTCICAWHRTCISDFRQLRHSCCIHDVTLLSMTRLWLAPVKQTCICHMRLEWMIYGGLELWLGACIHDTRLASVTCKLQWWLSTYISMTGNLHAAVTRNLCLHLRLAQMTCCLKLWLCTSVYDTALVWPCFLLLCLSACYKSHAWMTCSLQLWHGTCISDFNNFTDDLCLSAVTCICFHHTRLAWMSCGLPVKCCTCILDMRCMIDLRHVVVTLAQW